MGELRCWLGDFAVNGLLTLLAQAASDHVGLTIGGAIVMTGSVVLVLGLMIFCMTRILREKRPTEHHHTPLDIDTHDREA